MSDEARPPEDETPGPTAPSAPKVGLDKGDASGERGPWASPASDGTAEPTATAEEVPLAPSGDTTFGATGGAVGGVSGAEPTVETPTAEKPTPSFGHAPASSSGDVSASPFTPIGDAHAWPPPSPHDQRTVTSMPAADGTAATPPAQPWTNPFAPPAQTTTPAAPFAPPNPFAAPAGPAPYPQDSHVPPPPIAPDGPGQVPYGYPGGGYGYPGAAPQGYYGWPGMQPLPSNGMGTAGLVLGILSALVFCLWPLAIVLGVLGVIFGAIGRGKARRGVATNPGQALAGIICGAAGIALGIGMVVLLIVT
ncbi:hypothetical protein [Streptomyces sp. NPDC001652]|uniref:hypothetical protein n=1 Tax=Streptomyces sp. NPDC001652 TaxID=3154393 RepID=UPI0033190217